ncbi:hypothetical protein O988_05600 [Pseudogymnoascus sp. VKM F-3808]|nr:hypothetical protein O988_05600 [Pseudogymnoascus sp. VKM F-3808]
MAAYGAISVGSRYAGSPLAKVVKHRAIEDAESTRASFSSLLWIETVILSFEASNLRSEILPDFEAFTIPSIPILHTAPLPVSLPDLFLLVTPSFWQPFILWLATALVAPLAFAYFFNLTGRRSRGTQEFKYQFDPLTFNVAKAIITYSVFAGGYTFKGLVDLESVPRICSAAAGGWEGIVGGCAAGVLATVYEAINKVQVQMARKTSKRSGTPNPPRRRPETEKAQAHYVIANDNTNHDATALWSAFVATDHRRAAPDVMFGKQKSCGQREECSYLTQGRAILKPVLPVFILVFILF